jgi:peptidyl-dipeptidase Dcp
MRLFSGHNDKIYLEYKHNRFKAINLATLKKDKKLTQYYLQQFELAGPIYQRIK